MSLDVANKTNIDLQKVIKKQSLQLTEIQTHYDEIQRQLQQTLDQYGVAQRRLQSLNGELEEVRSHLDSSNRAKRTIELQYEEATTRIAELTSINVNLQSTKIKLEQELAVISADYEEVTKELRISDERYQKIQVCFKRIFIKIYLFFKHNLPYRLISSTPWRAFMRSTNASLKSKLSRSHWKSKSR